MLQDGLRVKISDQFSHDDDEEGSVADEHDDDDDDDGGDDDDDDQLEDEGRVNIRNQLGHVAFHLQTLKID